MNTFFLAVADLLEYPPPAWDDAVRRCRAALSGTFPEVDGPLERFEQKMVAMPHAEREELYVHTFELNPPCTLEVGYHVFGETYKRGTFLAHLRREEDRYGLELNQQLPDFLPVLLRLLGIIDDLELRDSLIGTCIIPAIETIVGAMKDKDNPYGDLLTSLLAALRADRGMRADELEAHHPEMNGHV